MAARRDDEQAATLTRMSNPLTVEEFIALGSVEAITANLVKRGSPFDSETGQRARLACDLLTARELAGAVHGVDDAVDKLTATVLKLDKVATRFQWATIFLGVVGVIVAIVTLLG